jgi:alkylresorcinol/alkylpyrone synthase
VTGPVLTDFRPLIPKHRMEQEQFRTNIFEVLDGREGVDTETLRAALQRYIVSPKYIEGRNLEFLSRYSGGPALADNEDTSAMALDERMAIYQEAARSAFRRLFDPDEDPPDDLIHVTCTGYESPSPAQRIVAEHAWPTMVTHAYHMGCAASLPSIRMAAGFLASGDLYGGKRRVDLVHTELVSAHSIAPEALVDPEVLILRSLFADGIIRYSMLAPGELAAGERGLRIRAFLERIVPGTEPDMTWKLKPDRFIMTLSPKVPFVLAKHIESFTEELFERAGLSFAEEKDRMVFAIHPGGPRIVDLLQRRLGLRDDQVRWSREVLRDHGNMSSATLPHIWGRIVADPSVPVGTPVMAIGFGPGLGAHGVLTELVAGDAE